MNPIKNIFCLFTKREIIYISQSWNSLQNHITLLYIILLKHVNQSGYYRNNNNSLNLHNHQSIVVNNLRGLLCASIMMLKGIPVKNLPEWYRHVPDADLTPEIKEQLLREDFENDQKLRFEDWRINPVRSGVIYALKFSWQRIPVYNGPLFTDNYPNNSFLSSDDIQRAINMIVSRFLPVITKEFYAVNSQLDLFGEAYPPKEPVIYDLPVNDFTINKKRIFK